jgi:hypothetical protein
LKPFDRPVSYKASGAINACIKRWADAFPQCSFTTCERFADKVATDRHNNSAAIALFLEVAGPILDGEVTLITAAEISAKT